MSPTGAPHVADLFAVEAKRADHQETLTWSFPAFSGDELEFDLVPAGIHRFNPGLYHEGTAFGHGVRSHRAQPPQGGAR